MSNRNPQVNWTHHNQAYFCNTWSARMEPSSPAFSVFLPYSQTYLPDVSVSDLTDADEEHEEEDDLMDTDDDARDEAVDDNDDDDEGGADGNLDENLDGDEVEVEEKAGEEEKEKEGKGGEEEDAAESDKENGDEGVDDETNGFSDPSEKEGGDSRRVEIRFSNVPQGLNRSQLKKELEKSIGAKVDITTIQGM